MLEPEKKKLGDLDYSEIFVEEGPPDPPLGYVYDIYINSLTSEVYKKTSTGWVLKGTLADKNINPDWDETDTNKKSYILNKPDFVTPKMLIDLENDLGIQIEDIESLVDQLGVLGLTFDTSDNTLNITRPDNSKKTVLVLPTCNGVIDGLLDKDTYLKILQMEKDIENFEESNTTYVTGGAAYNYTLTVPGITNYSQLEGKKIFVKFHTASNFGTNRININSLGDKQITRDGSSVPIHILKDAIWMLEFNGTAFIIVSAYYQAMVSQPDAEAGTIVTEKAWSPQRVKQAIEALAPKYTPPPTYGTSSTAAGTVAKDATVTNFTLSVGAMVYLKFSNACTVNSPTLNVENTGAKPIQYMGYPVVNGMILANSLFQFVYDGTNWCLMNSATIKVANESTANTLAAINPNAPIFWVDP